MSNPLVALLRDVPRFNVTVGDHTDPSVLMLEADVLAALTNAEHFIISKADLPDDEAGKVLDALKYACLVSAPGVSAQTVSDLITRLLAARAADAERIRGLEAERDISAEGWAEATGLIRAARQQYSEEKARAEDAKARIAALTAQVERMRGALGHIESMSVHSGGEIHGVTALHWKVAFEEAQDVARAAITEEPK